MPPRLPDDFPDLPSFDARTFEPPVWAKESYQRKGPSLPAESSDEERVSQGGDDGEGDVKWAGPGSNEEAGVEPDGGAETLRFTIDELKVCSSGYKD